MATLHKRPRTPSHSPPSSKASRTAPLSSTDPPSDSNSPSSNTEHPLLCTLPPTCNRRPTPLANSKELEAHYATYHAHVCEQPGCGCVFPDARLLDLHQTECHDPLAALRKDRGEKIFACHLPTCARLFATPKTRRLHLIEAHGYPKEFFFAVTNKGVGGLLKKWGEGASLIRKEWKPRESQKNGTNAIRENVGMDMDEDGSDEDEVSEEKETDEEDLDNNLTPRMAPRMRPAPAQYPQPQADLSKSNAPNANAMDALTNSLDALSLVPPSIRFGRGGKNGGFTHRGGAYIHTGPPAQQQQQIQGGGRGRGRGQARSGVQLNANRMDTDGIDVKQSESGMLQQAPGRGHNLGAAGRGRAGIVHIPARGREGRDRPPHTRGGAASFRGMVHRVG